MTIHAIMATKHPFSYHSLLLDELEDVFDVCVDLEDVEEERDVGLVVGLETGRDVEVLVDILRPSHISLSDARFWL